MFPTSDRSRTSSTSGDIASWGNDQFWLFPNLSIQIWARNYYITYTYWPETVDSHIYEIDLYFVPPANAHERLAQELVVDSTIEFAMQDVNTIEATHSAPEDAGAEHFHLSDQELLIRQFHTVIRDTVAAYQSARSSDDDHSATLPAGFADLEPFVADWALPTRAATLRGTAVEALRRAGRVLRRHRAAGRGGDRLPRRLDIDDLPDDADPAAAPAVLDDPGLLRRQRVQADRIPDSGAAFFDMVAEPAV